MNLLQKLNLEPDRLGSTLERRYIISTVGSNAQIPIRRFLSLCEFAHDLPSNLTNAEFLAACEEWLKKN